MLEVGYIGEVSIEIDSFGRVIQKCVGGIAAVKVVELTRITRISSVSRENDEIDCEIGCMSKMNMAWLYPQMFCVFYSPLEQRRSSSS